MNGRLRMKEEGRICHSPLEYRNEDELMEYAICHKKEQSKTRCVKGHFVCNACHISGVDRIIGICRKETPKNPVEIVTGLMSEPFCHMHGPEHHIMAGCAFLTVYKFAGWLGCI